MLEQLYNHIDAKNLGLIYCTIPYDLDGLYTDNTIYLSKTLTSAEERCVLAEEIGHHETSYGNILDLSDTDNQKQELRARNWASEKLVTLKGLTTAYKSGVRNHYELAEFLGITEEFLDESLAYLKKKHGIYAVFGGHIVYFEPALMVMTRL